MRHVLLIGVVWLAGVTPASAQVSERLAIAAVVRADRVSFEGSQNARLPVTGVAIGYRIWSHMLIEGEITTASGESSRSYEGDFHLVCCWSECDARRVPAHGRHRTPDDDQQGRPRVRDRRGGRNARAWPREPRIARRRQLPAVPIHRGHDGASRPGRGDVRAGRSRDARFRAAAWTRRPSVWRQRARSIIGPPSRRARSAMGVGRSGP